MLIFLFIILLRCLKKVSKDPEFTSLASNAALVISEKSITSESATVIPQPISPVKDSSLTIAPDYDSSLSKGIDTYISEATVPSVQISEVKDLVATEEIVIPALIIHDVSP